MTLQRHSRSRCWAFDDDCAIQLACIMMASRTTQQASASDFDRPLYSIFPALVPHPPTFPHLNPFPSSHVGHTVQCHAFFASY